MTTNALVALTGATQLTEIEQMVLDEMAQDKAAFDLQPARIKIAPGGIGQFLLGDETVKSFTAIVALSQKIRGYWPDSGTGQAPLCSSPDGSRGIFNPEPSDDQFKAAASARTPHPGIVALTNNQPLSETYACATCPMNQWGSEHQRRGGQGKGRACKEMRRLLLFVDGRALPALMSLPPTSIKTWDAYCSALHAKRSAYFAVRTRFELDKATAAGGETYNVVKLSQAGAIDDKTLLAAVVEARSQFREFVSGAPIVADEYDTQPAENGDGQEMLPF